MSRLIDELNRVARTTQEPMGFTTARKAASEPRMLLIASLAPTGDIARLVEGSDAVLFRPAKAGLTASSLQKTVKSLPDIPWGAWLEDTDDKKGDLLIKSGCDFSIFP